MLSRRAHETPLKVVVFVICLLAGTTQAQGQFTAGNLAVLAVESGALDSGQTVFIHEYRRDGSGLEQAIQISGLTISNSIPAAEDGVLSLSGDGRYLTFGGYNQPDETAGVRATAGARLIARMDGAENVAFTTITTAGLNYTGRAIRAVASDDGSRYWEASTGSPPIGVRTTVDGTGATTVVQTGSGTGTRALHVFGGRLYGTFPGQPTPPPNGPVSGGIFQYDSAALPTGLSARSALPGIGEGGNDFVMLDRDAATPGLDTIYVVGERGTDGSLLKYAFDTQDAVWELVGDLTISGLVYYDIAADLSGSNAELFFVAGSGVGNQIIRFTDDAAFNQSFGFNPALDAPLVIGTSTAAGIFRSIEFTPTPVPEPASAILLAIAGVLGWRRARRSRHVAGQ